MGLFGEYLGLILQEGQEPGVPELKVLGTAWAPSSVPTGSHYGHVLVCVTVVNVSKVHVYQDVLGFTIAVIRAP